MTPDDLDRILSSEDFLEPSSGFQTAVMAAIRRQASEPPPLLFPWIRFVTGLAASAVMAATGTVLLSGPSSPLASLADSLTPLAPLALLSGIAPELGYAVASLLAGLALVSLPRLLGHLMVDLPD